MWKPKDLHLKYISCPSIEFELNINGVSGVQDDSGDEEWKNPGSESAQKDDFDMSEFRQFHAKLNFAAAKEASEVEQEESSTNEKPSKKAAKAKEEPAEELNQKLPEPTPEIVEEKPKKVEVDENLKSELKSAMEKLAKSGNVKLRKSATIKFGLDESTWYEALEQIQSECKIDERFRSVDALHPLVKKLRERAVKLAQNEVWRPNLRTLENQWL